jgi:phenylacetate-CoA ligase
VSSALRRHGVPVPAHLPARVLALEGRDRERLPDGSHVAIYKDALYADGEVARTVTGAFRVIVAGGRSTMHVQLSPQGSAGAALEARLLAVLPAAARPARLVFWPYHRFPFGMTVDYERKFTYFAPGEPEPPAA